MNWPASRHRAAATQVERSILAVALAGWLSFVPVLGAQADWSAVQKLSVGTVIRIRAGSHDTTGALQSASDVDVAVTDRSGRIARFDRAAIDRIDAFAGDPHPRRRAALKWALWSALLTIPATLGAELGGSARRDLPLLYCMIVCGGAALGAWLADDATVVPVYVRSLDPHRSP